MAPQDTFQACIIGVHHTGAAQREQLRLAFHIFFHVFVLHAADMVLRKIGEHSHRKGETIDAQIFQPNGRSFHHTVFAASVCHAPQIHLYIVTHGGGVVRGDQFVADQHADRTDHSSLMAGGL